MIERGEGPAATTGDLAVFSAKLGALGEMLEQNRQSMLQTEGRMVQVVDKLAERLEKSTDKLGDLLQQQTRANEDRVDQLLDKVTASEDGLGKRIAKAEGEQQVLRAFVAFAVIAIPMVTGLAVWLYEQQISLSPADVLELRLQLDDLRRHKQLGGRGSFWISPDRRIYAKGDSEAPPPPRR